MTDYEGFRLDLDAAAGIATVTLDVPGKLNRVSMPARDELAEVFDRLGADGSVRAVILAGAGERAFRSAGRRGGRRSSRGNGGCRPGASGRR